LARSSTVELQGREKGWERTEHPGRGGKISKSSDNREKKSRPTPQRGFNKEVGWESIKGGSQRREGGILEGHKRRHREPRFSAFEKI